MKISKNSKKLMSIIMMMAFVFSSLVVTQKPAKAAGEAPTVKLMGATFRKAGSQALRFAIQIKNADKANDCGITIRANGKEKTISVSGGQNKIYEKDGNTNTITYTAAVTGIPVSYAASDFQISGFVTPIGGEIINTGTVSRNLTDVATAAGYQIDTSTGEIVATPMGGTEVQKKGWENWNEGYIPLGKDFGDKKVEISFEMRVEGADDVLMDFHTNYNGSTDPNDQNNPSKKDNTINNAWTSFTFQWNMPGCNAGEPVLYLTKSVGSTYDAGTMDLYYQNFSVSVVDENAVEGTVVNRFSDSDGAKETHTTTEPSLLNNKTVTTLTTTEGGQNPGIVVKFELPKGKILADYNTLSVRINADQSGFKYMGIDWRNSGDNKHSFDNGVDAYRIYPREDRHYQSSGNEWKTETFALDYDLSETDVTTMQDGQTVYLGILYNADPNTNIKFTDIILTKSN